MGPFFVLYVLVPLWTTLQVEQGGKKKCKTITVASLIFEQ